MSPSRRDLALAWGLRGTAALAGAVVVLIAGFLVVEALPALRRVGWTRFATDPSWHPVDGFYGLAPMLWGTLATALGAMLVAVPVGVLSAVFCRYYAPTSAATLYRRLIELLAGIPSVVYGFWGLVVLVPLIARLHPPGPSLLAGIVVLAVMIVPTIALLADASLEAVPQAYLHGAAALGLSRWATVRRVAFPAAKSGLFTAVILGMGRAVGETMAVLMVCGNVVQIPASLFDPVRTLAANIALEMAYAMGDHRSALFVGGLVLMAIILALVLAAERLSRRSVYG